jgi:integrase
MTTTTTTMSSNKELERSINSLTAGALPYFRNIFRQLALENLQNGGTLCQFLITEHTERNIKLSTRIAHIKIICWFNRFLNYKNFQEITKDDVTAYLSSLRRSETDDPCHRWIGTYNTRQMVLSKFFRWLYNQDQPNQDNWVTPGCMQGVKLLPRKERSSYTPSDIWTNEEHAIFLKYCPEKRDRCYHSMANDTSARPHELLALKIGDIKFKISSNGTQYAEVHLVESKTRPRTIPLIFSIPYVKDWIDSHPMAGNPDALLFPSLADSNYGQRLTENSLYKQYTRKYQKRYFPKLLKDSSIPEADKAYIRNLLTKPWNPYVQRHSALTAKSRILKESTLRDHAGWSATSKMLNVYLHYFGNESSKSLLEAYGVEKYNQEQIDILKAKSCPNCSEPNKPDGRFCAKCRMVLTYDAYNETLESQKEKESEIQNLKDQMRLLQESQREILECLKYPEKLAQIARES